MCSRLSDKPICTAVPAWAFSTVKRCAPFEKAGVYDRAAADMLLGAGAQWASRHGQILATTMPTETPQGHPWLSTIYQPLLDQTLREALDRHPGVEMRLGQELTALAEVGDGIQMTFRQSDGSIGTAHARFVIGCDARQ